MPIPQPIDPNRIWEDLDVCDFAAKWGISLMLAQRLVAMQAQYPAQLTIISGARTEASQNALRQAGRPTADNDKSTHLACPATGADLRPGVGVGPGKEGLEVKIAFGTAAVFAGLRWGGGSPIGLGGVPSDWRHVDLGPRG